MLLEESFINFAADIVHNKMEQLNTRENFLKKFAAAKQRKQEMVEKMKEDITVEYEKIHGEKPKKFFVL